MQSSFFAKVQDLGRALMLPIAVLPIAGLLLRLGQPDVLDIKFIADSGGAIFDNLPLLFAIGIAIGIARDNHGVAGLAGAIGQLVLLAVLKDMDPKLNMGVLSGIISGITAGMLYNRFKDVKLYSFLAFFGGKRFVPIVTGLACVILGIILGFVWPPIQALIDAAGQWIVSAGAIGTFIYGFLNRLLIVTGLHHIINSLVWFVFGSFTPPDGGAAVAGDLHRFFKGDPTAGSFMAGFFPVMMFGLPAACLAMYHSIPKERRYLAGGMLLSMALTSFLTGVTEPIEFGFMFLAPVLYVIHAFLTGLSLMICQLLDIKLGFTFSGGAIDFVLNYGLSTHGWYAIPLGIVYAFVYYGLFRYFIKAYNMQTPGREAPLSDEATIPAANLSTFNANATRAARYIAALGGASNLKSLAACATRLRLVVEDSGPIIEEATLKSLGAKGVLKLANNQVQVIIGPEADLILGEIRQVLEQQKS